MRRDPAYLQARNKEFSRILRAAGCLWVSGGSFITGYWAFTKDYGAPTLRTSDHPAGMGWQGVGPVVVDLDLDDGIDALQEGIACLRAEHELWTAAQEADILLDFEDGDCVLSVAGLELRQPINADNYTDVGVEFGGQVARHTGNDYLGYATEDYIFDTLPEVYPEWFR